MPTLAEQWIGLARETPGPPYVHTWAPTGRTTDDGWADETGHTWTVTVDPWAFLDVDVRELVARRLLEHYGLPAPDGVNGFRSGRPVGFRRGR